MQPPRLVNDFAHMMNAGEEEQLKEKLEAFDKNTSTQIAVVTISDLNGADIASYATALGHKWKVGRNGKDNGVVVLASKNDRKVFISVGYGLEGALTDMLSGQIVREEIIPSFKEGNYYEGFDKGTDAIIKAVKGEYKADPDNGDDKDNFGVGIIVLIIIIIVIIAIIRRGGRGGGGGGSYYSRRGNDILTGMLLSDLFNGGGRHSGGGGWGGGSSGGGFGGFGGGNFGGGGAGGSW